MKITEIADWTEIQGVLLDGNYPLVECVEQADEWALFHTISGNVTRNVRVRFLDGQQVLPLWKKLQRSPHPNLVRIEDAGHFPVHGGVLEYAVMEHWDDTLAGVLPERELTSAEASEMLESILPALSHLHSLGVVHGGIAPAKIVSAGGKIKLEVMEPHAMGPGKFSAAADIAAVGATVAECLARGRSGGAGLVLEPFGAIVRRCLNEDAAKRPSAAEVLALLHGEYVEHPEPVTVSEAEPARRVVSRRPVLLGAVGLIGVTALLGFLILRHPSAKPAPEPQPPPPVVVAAPPAARVEPRPAPPVVSSTRDVWRVIAYTFAKAKDAEKRVERINEKWPDAHAEVFSIVPGRSPFLVAVGGRMNRDEAQRFRKRAVAHGLPSGAYSQNFNH